jgi:hypothetical protein
MKNSLMIVNSKAGIDPKRVLNSDKFTALNEVLTCRICFNILINPTDCVKCGNTFCQDCINELVQKDCPFGCKGIAVKPTSHGIMAILSQLKFSCLNRSYGCEEILSYSNVLKHDHACEYSIGTCPNFGCGVEKKRQLLEFHIRNECEYSMFKCEGCGTDFNRGEYSGHIERCKSINESLGNIDTGGVGGFMDINGDVKVFMKIIWFHLSKISHETERRHTAVMEEIKCIRQDIAGLAAHNDIKIESISTKLVSLENNLKLNNSIDCISTKNDSLLVNSSNTAQAKVDSNIIRKVSTSPVKKQTEPKQALKKVIILKPQECVKKFKLDENKLGSAQSRIPRTTGSTTTVSRFKSNSPRPYGQNIVGDNLIKTDNKLYLANQTMIIDLLNKILIKIDHLELTNIQRIEGLQELLTDGIAEEIKNYNLKISLETSDRIIKSFQEVQR